MMNRSPGSQSMMMAGSTRESQQATTATAGYCPDASCANSSGSLRKYCTRNRWKPSSNLLIGSTLVPYLQTGQMILSIVRICQTRCRGLAACFTARLVFVQAYRYNSPASTGYRQRRRGPRRDRQSVNAGTQRRRPRRAFHLLHTEHTMNHPMRFTYPLFDDLPARLRALYINILLIMGIGYIFAMTQIYEVHAGRDGKQGLSVRDLPIAYSGDQSDSRLEAALKGPMRSMLPDDERAAIISWVRDNTNEADYTTQIKPIIEGRCLMCRGGGGPRGPGRAGGAGGAGRARRDTGGS